MSITAHWEFEPIPRYFFYLGDSCVGEVVFDGFKSAVCNGFDPEGEEWRAIAGDGLIGRYGSFGEALEAVRSRVMDRGLVLVRAIPAVVKP